MALLDAVIMPEWEHRYFSFDGNWSKGEMMGSVRDGLGAECFIHFTKFGAVGKVLSGPSLPNVSDIPKRIPEGFSGFVDEPAFNVSEASFFFWRRYSDDYWSVYPDNLDEYDWLGTLKNGCLSYRLWAESYYERSFPARVVESVYSGLRVTEGDVVELNPAIRLGDLQDDICGILGG
ncbi:hypothetical protein [Fulvitalea axinellae]